MQYLISANVFDDDLSNDVLATGFVDFENSVSKMLKHLSDCVYD